MNKALKVTAIAAGVLLALGLVLALVGFAMGGFKPVVYGNGGWYVESPLIAGNVVEETVEGNFGSLNIQVDSQKVRFVESDTLKVVYSYDDGVDVMSHRVDGDTLHITGQTRSSGGRFNVTLFGYRTGFNSGSNRTSEVIVYCPKDAQFDRVTIDSDAAAVSAQGFIADRLDVNVDFGAVKLEDIQAGVLHIDAAAGDVSIKNVTAKDSEIDMDFGKLRAENFVTGDLAVDSDAGDVSLKGTFTGRTVLNCDFGAVTVETSLPREDYRYSIAVDFGKLSFDGESRSGMGSSHEGGSGDNYLEIQASAGDVTVRFDR